MRESGNGEDAVTLAHPSGASARITHHGAHVVSWIDASGKERLYLSPRAQFGPGDPRRHSGHLSAVWDRSASQARLAPDAPLVADSAPWLQRHFPDHRRRPDKSAVAISVRGGADRGACRHADRLVADHQLGRLALLVHSSPA